MPDGEEDISWSWITEALPSMKLTEVLYAPVFMQSYLDYPASVFLLQKMFDLAMILATPSQCNLTSLNVFEENIPQVSKHEAIHFLNKGYSLLNSFSRFTKDCRKT